MNVNSEPLAITMMSVPKRSETVTLWSGPRVCSVVMAEKSAPLP